MYHTSIFSLGVILEILLHGVSSLGHVPKILAKNVPFIDLSLFAVQYMDIDSQASKSGLTYNWKKHPYCLHHLSSSMETRTMNEMNQKQKQYSLSLMIFPGRQKEDSLHNDAKIQKTKRQ